MKRQIVAVVATVGMMFGTAACTVESKPSDPVTVTASPTPEEEPQTMDEAFVEVVKDNTDDFDSVSEQQLVDLAHSMCGAWDSGASFEFLGKTMMDEGFSPEDSGFFIGAGTQAYCPEHIDKIPGGSNV